MSVKFGCGFRRIGSVDEVSAVFAEALMAGRFDGFFTEAGIPKDEVLSVGVICEEWNRMVLGEDLDLEDFFPGKGGASVVRNLRSAGGRILLGAGSVSLETFPGEITAYAILLDSPQRASLEESFLLCVFGFRVEDDSGRITSHFLYP